MGLIAFCQIKDQEKTEHFVLDKCQPIYSANSSVNLVSLFMHLGFMLNFQLVWLLLDV